MAEIKKTLVAIDRDGNEVPIGSKIGNSGAILIECTRANEFRYGGGRSGKIVYKNGNWQEEVYDKAFDLTVIDTELEEGYNASTKKMNKPFSEMVKEQRAKNIKKSDAPLIDGIVVTDSNGGSKKFDKGSGVDVLDDAIEYARQRLREMCGVGDTITIEITECDDGM